jgi:hypothetical protein
MAETLFPTTIAGFTEYIKTTYHKAQTNLPQYNINPEKLDAITPLYNDYITAEALAANPDTATKGNRHARDTARKTLQPAWRRFLNENIRYNSAVPQTDREAFGIKRRNHTRTHVGIPDTVPLISVKQVGAHRYEIEVLNSDTGKKKKPLYAAGSFIYVAITEPGQEPQHESEYRKLDFSSNCHHVVEFPLEQLAKQANLYARYSNAHGKEGPEGSTKTVIIG